MPSFAESLLNRPAAVVMLECLEVSHPSFTQTYYIVRNAPDGVTVTHEDATTHDYVYYPVRIDRGSTTDDLDQSLSISLGELGTVLPSEIDLVLSGIFADIKPLVTYRVYQHTDLSQPVFLIEPLEVSSMSRDSAGVTTFTAKAQELNNTKTGELYTVELYPALRGFL
ncbi:MAG: DUF1833 family protein [Pseudomonadota bacterium]|nr:DUF1833 family protein [Pseudomonadota bacterium]